VLATAGVKGATPIVIGFSDWRLPNGEMTPVFVVGTDLKSGGLHPWNVTEGSVNALEADEAVAVDQTYYKRLGVSGPGSTADLRGRPVRVAAVTDGIRSFTTTPYVFADLKHARDYTGIPANKISYLLVTLKAGADVAQVQHALHAAIPNIEALTPAAFRDRSRSFWLFGTGAGAALFAGALLGLIVGTVIVAQTLYSSTKDHLDEFATLRALGSSNAYIYRVIIYQALLSAIIGFCFAAAIGFVVVEVTTKGALPIVITPALIAAILALTVAMCVASALAAILRVLRIDPVMVFTR
jgi:putative ABC transport system permease protein